jgi:hypothetical protein
MALARSENSRQKFTARSRKSGRSATPTTTFWNIRRKGPWISLRIEWFLGCLTRAIDGAQETLSAILAKALFCDRIKDVTLNDRQRNAANRVLDGFEGKLMTPKIHNACRVLTGQSLSDIQETDRAWRPGSESWRGAHHRLFTGSIAKTNQRACARDRHRKGEPARGRGEA